MMAQNASEPCWREILIDRTQGTDINNGYCESLFDKVRDERSDH